MVSGIVETAFSRRVFEIAVFTKSDPYGKIVLHPRLVPRRPVKGSYCNIPSLRPMYFDPVYFTLGSMTTFFKI